MISGYYSSCLVRSEGEKKRLDKIAKAEAEKKEREVKEEEQEQQEDLDPSWWGENEEDWDVDAEAYDLFSNVNFYH